MDVVVPRGTFVLVVTVVGNELNRDHVSTLQSSFVYGHVYGDVRYLKLLETCHVIHAVLFPASETSSEDALSVAQ
jgi:hypothetical protein